MIRRLIVCLGFMLCAWPAAAQTLHRGNAADPDTLDPHKYGLTVELNIINDLFEGLAVADAYGEPVPGVAESWTVSPDGTVYTFKLREGVVWSDGVPLTAEDVLAGFRRAVDPKTAAQLVDLCFLVKNARAIANGEMAVEALGARIVDARTFEVTLEGPSATFVRRLSGFSLFHPVPRHAIERHGDGWVKPGVMVSNGAYTLTEWVPQSRVRLTRNPRFHDAANVAIDEVIFYPTVDDSAALKQFRNGELDLNQGFPPGQYEWLKQNYPAETRADPVSQVTFLTLNVANPKFADKRVRRALSLAIDRETITGKVLGNGQIPGYSIFPDIAVNWKAPPEDSFAHIPLADRQAEARALLEAAGYGPDNPLRFRLDYRGSDPNKRVIVAIAGMWKAIGVIADVQANEVKVHYAQLRQHDFEVADAGWQGTAEPEFFINLLGTGSDTNYSGWSNPEFDRLVAEAVATLDLPRRLELFQQADRIAIEDTAMIVLFYNVQRALVHQWVKGYEPNPINTHLTRWIRIER